MCGIAGILSFTYPVEIASVERMISILQHRGPDDGGTWVDESGKVAFGHRRLSIIDTSPLGKQPMHYLGRYSITFNGEIYNYLEIRKDLENRGYKFSSQSDTEVLLALYDLKKELALNDLDGMFAFAIWDKERNELFCARDRFGEKPFFYSGNKERFVFGSEMKALLSIGISSRKNQEKIYNYLLYSVLEKQEGTETFFSDIHQLRASHYMRIDSRGQVTQHRYWDLDLGKRIALPESECSEKFRELLTRSVSRRLRSDVPVGSSLSGGLDSSSIVMLIAGLKKEGNIQKTFSARFRDFARDEGKYMNLVIENAGVEPHFVFPTVDSVMQNLEKIMYHQEEPFGSTSIAAQFEVMQLAKENGISVLLDGQGADETLAGYPWYWYTYFHQLLRTDKNKLRYEEEQYRKIHNTLPYENNLEFRWRAFHGKSLSLAGEIGRRLKPDHSSYFLGIHPDMVHAFKKKPNPIPKAKTLREHLYYSALGNGLNELLRYADRNSMAHSVEVRLPFLSHELVEFAFSLPDEMLLHNGWTKLILRNSMSALLPDEITWRKDKVGFEPPQDDWMKSERFKDDLETAKKSLLKDHIIQAEVPGLSWKYISLYLFNERFK